MSHDFDVIIIGGGHAGAEAAWAAARIGAKTAMITFGRAAIGRMSCNPAIGGIGKGQMVREIDALGGLMGLVADQTGIQFRMLNRSKGPAVWAPRCQSDRDLYAAAVREHLESCTNLTIIEAGVESIDFGVIPDSEIPNPKSRIAGVTLCDGRRLRAAAVVVTSGTFLRALMHCGERKTEGGRIGEAAAVGLSASLKQLGLELGRLKTGTPPRIARSTIDYSRLVEQPGDDVPAPFSFMTDRIRQTQIPCWITWTNADVHELIRQNLHRAPMYSGQIESRGPRYCPSIEDKVVRFADKEKHQIFLEPEGRDSDRIYVNGISTSLPQDVQDRIVHGIEGLERAEVLQWGYAVEYDFVPPEQIDASLMTKRVAGLFLAGQINGTSGYEEAAGQGLLAGINAARYAAHPREFSISSVEPGWQLQDPGFKSRSPLILRRDQAYLGVMIDDLVTRGVIEPYRMFTSRAEHRLILRYDNADARLTPLGRQIGLVASERLRQFERRQRALHELLQRVSMLRYEGRSIREWLKRPDEDGVRFLTAVPELSEAAGLPDLWAAALVQIKYEGYILREERVIERRGEMEDRAIPPSLDYTSIPHLRREAVERWSSVRPYNLGQAGRVSGISPADITILMVQLAAFDRDSGMKP